jgi:hypothetical protein
MMLPILLLLSASIVQAFSPLVHHRRVRVDRLPIKATPVQEDQETSTAAGTATSTPDQHDVTPNGDGLPWWWELVWKLDIMKRGEDGSDIIFGDTAHVLRTNIEQIYGNYPSLDGCPLAEGEITDIADGTMFIGLQRYNQRYGSPYKLCFGPKSFLVVSDPVQMRHLLRDANTDYDKVSNCLNLMRSSEKQCSLTC